MKKKTMDLNSKVGNFIKETYLFSHMATGGSVCFDAISGTNVMIHLINLNSNRDFLFIADFDVAFFVFHKLAKVDIWRKEIEWNQHA